MAGGNDERKDEEKLSFAMAKPQKTVEMKSNTMYQIHVINLRNMLRFEA